MGADRVTTIVRCGATGTYYGPGPPELSSATSTQPTAEADSGLLPVRGKLSTFVDGALSDVVDFSGSGVFYGNGVFSAFVAFSDYGSFSFVFISFGILGGQSSTR